MMVIQKVKILKKTWTMTVDVMVAQMIIVVSDIHAKYAMCVSMFELFSHVFLYPESSNSSAQTLVLMQHKSDMNIKFFKSFMIL